MPKSLAPYMKKKVFVLRNTATGREAAKTMGEHSVGCVLVSDGLGHIRGIVTDRDLARSIVASNKDADILLDDITKKEIYAIDEHQELDDAVKVMCDHGVRRVPILHNEKSGRQRCVGMVTLDELIFRKFGSIDILSNIIRPQIRTRHFNKSKEDQRRKDHQEHTLNLFYKVLAREMKLSKPATIAVGGFLLAEVLQRITARDSKHFIAALPKLLQAELVALRAGPNRKITPRVLLQKLDEDFGLDTKEAYRVIRGFWNGLEVFLQGHQTEHLLNQLPKELQILFTGEPYKRSRPMLLIASANP